MIQTSLYCWCFYWFSCSLIVTIENSMDLSSDSGGNHNDKVEYEIEKSTQQVDELKKEDMTCFKSLPIPTSPQASYLLFLWVECAGNWKTKASMVSQLEEGLEDRTLHVSV